MVQQTDSQLSGFSPSQRLYEFIVIIIIIIIITLLTPFCGTFIVVFFTDNEEDGKEQPSDWLHYGSRDHGVRSRDKNVMPTISS